MRFMHLAWMARWVGLVGGMLLSVTVYADIAVIAHPELNAKKVSKRELARVFLGEHSNRLYAANRAGSHSQSTF